MRSAVKLIFILLMPFIAAAQDGKKYEDSLLAALSHASNDTVRIDINRKLGFFHEDADGAKALVYFEAQRDLAKKMQLRLWEADAYQQIGYCYIRLLKLPAAYENLMQALKIAEDPATATNGWGYSNFSNSKNPDEARQSIVGMIHFELFSFYNLTRNFDEAFKQSLKAFEIGRHLNNKKILGLASRDIGTYYLNHDNLDSAFIYYQKSLFHYANSPYQKNLGTVYGNLGQYYEKKKQYDSAQIAYDKGIDVSLNNEAGRLHGNLLALKGEAYIATGSLDSALMYTLQANKLANAVNDLQGTALSLAQLGVIYKLRKEYALAYDYAEKGRLLKENITDAYIDKLVQFQNLDFDQKIKLQNLEKESQLSKSRNRMYGVLVGLGIFLLLGILLYRNNLQKQKANKVLESTLTNLKSTQSQLIQSEKMASLGELTAGIAHEIQNPLNFVNNFSEVSNELIDEMNAELDKGDINEAKLIAADVKQNLEKINHHGKRADAIVKGMLQHSRSSSGVKEPTNINALADEYLRLAYHGLRAKDKSFNATMKTDFDESIGSINIIPQDIGRVILNLITNAFYAVDEKKTLRQAQGDRQYEPTVSLATKKINGRIEISVSDNGNGISPNVIDKIFQPFFTTKPTGQGTGLGLSMSYDIIKAHGGELKMETKDARPDDPVGRGEGTTFIIQLTT